MPNNNENIETVRAIQSLERVMGKMADNLEETSRALTGKSNVFYDNFKEAMLSSLGKNDANRLEKEAAIKQHEEVLASNRRAAGPDRNDPDYYDKLFAVTPKSQSDIYSEAIRKSMSDAQTQQAMKQIFSSNTIKEAMGSGVDARTMSEKLMDKMGLGGINRMTKWFQDRNVRREEKATKKDQVEIKRGMEERARLAAKYRKMKESGASQEKLDDMMTKLQAVGNKIQQAEGRIDRRRRDPYADLVEMGSPEAAAVISGLAAQGKSGGHPGGADPKEFADLDRKLKAKLQPEFYEKGTLFFEKMLNGDASVGGGVGGGGGAGGGGGSSTLGWLLGSGGMLGLLSRLRGKNGKDKGTGKDKGKGKDSKNKNNKPNDKAKDAQKKAKEAEKRAKEAEKKAKQARKSAQEAEKKAAKEAEKKAAKKATEKAAREAEKKAAKKAAEQAAKKATEQATKQAARKAAVTAGAKVAGKAAAKFIPGVGWVMTAVDVGQIGYAAGKLAHTNSQVEKSLNESLDKNNANLDVRKNEKNKAYYDAIKESNKKDVELTTRSNSIWANIKNAAAHAVGMKSELDELKEAKDKADAMLNEEKAKYAELKAKEREKEKETKLAAGSMEQTSAPTAQTPGANTQVSTIYNFTAELEKIQEATYQGTKRALLDADVQRKNEENAKLQGKEINNRLVGS